jgi:hypothetical protein
VSGAVGSSSSSGQDGEGEEGAGEEELMWVEAPQVWRALHTILTPILGWPASVCVCVLPMYRDHAVSVLTTPAANPPVVAALPRCRVRLWMLMMMMRKLVSCVSSPGKPAMVVRCSRGGPAMMCCSRTRGIETTAQ